MMRLLKLNCVISLFISTVFCQSEESANLYTDPNTGEKIFVLKEILVQADAIIAVEDTKFRAKKNTSGIGLEVDRMNSPVTVNTLTSELLETQQTVDIREAFDNIAGVTQSGSGSKELPIIRGFDARRSIFKNNSRVGGAAPLGELLAPTTEVSNIERVEVLKGPSAILYGNMEPGGIINYITESPEQFFGAEAKAFYGSEDFLKGLLDITGPIGESDFSYRVNASWTEQDTYRGSLRDQDRLFLAPALSWQPSEDTLMLFRGEFTQDNVPTDAGLFYDRGNAVPNTNQSTVYGVPNINIEETEIVRGDLDFEHRFSDFFKIDYHGSFNQMRKRINQSALVPIQEVLDSAAILATLFGGTPRVSNFDSSAMLIDDTVIQEGNYTGFTVFAVAELLELGFLGDPPLTYGTAQEGSVLVLHQNNKVYTNEYGAQANHIFEFETGEAFDQAISHQMLVRFDMEFLPYEFYSSDSGLIFGLQDAIDPVYPETLDFLPLQLTTDEETFSYGISAQHLISFGEYLHILLGGRFSHFDRDYKDQDIILENGDVDTGLGFTDTSDSIDPRFGVVLRPIEEMSVYGAFSTAFNTENRITRVGAPVKPTTSEQIEVGMKFDLLKSRLGIEFSLFQVIKQDLVVVDPTNDRFAEPAENFYLNIGEETTRGLELEITGELFSGFDLQLSYAYLDARLSNDETRGYTGNRKKGVPYHSGSISAVYEVQEGALKGFGMGTSCFLRDTVQNDDANTFTLYGWVRNDALIYYRQEHWKAQINFKNIFDVEYLLPAGTESTPNTVFPAPPFTIIGSLGVNF
ncbi:MAG: TonB-dependent receptor [Verrucomicrobiota bacterium]